MLREQTGSEPHHATNPVSDDRCSLLKACSHRPLRLRVHSRPDVTRVRCCVGLCSLPHTSCFSCPTEAAHRQSQSPMEFIHEGESPNFSASPSAASEGHGETHSLGGRPPRSSGQRVTRGTAYPHVGALHLSSATRSVLKETQRKVTVV